MERKISFAIGEYYHIYNRGVEKRNIFTNDSDYKRFNKLLFVKIKNKKCAGKIRYTT